MDTTGRVNNLKNNAEKSHIIMARINPRKKLYNPKNPAIFITPNLFITAIFLLYKKSIKTFLKDKKLRQQVK